MEATSQSGERQQRAAAADDRETGLAGFFRLGERRTSVGTEVRAGLTTFMVMAYIIFVNPTILAGGPLAPVDAGGTGLGPPFIPVAVATALAGGILTIAMGLATNYPFAMAAGLGLNAVVAFELILTRGLSWQQAMAVIIWEGLIITVLVLTGLRQAIMEAIPTNLKRAIAVGIGLFILFIGLVNGGFVARGAEGGPVVAPGSITNVGTLTFVVGLAIALALMAMRVRGALLISIIATTLIAIALNAVVGPENSGFAPNTAVLPEQYFFDFSADNFQTIGQPIAAMLEVWTAAPVLIVALVIFSLMLSDFFDTMGTVVGVGEQAGLVDESGRLPGVGRVLLVDSLGAVLGGAFGVSSNTTYIESAAGVSEGGRTGLTAVVVGILFLLAILIAPIAGIVPAQATAPALVIVGFLMFTIAREFEWGDIDEMFPVLVTAIVMPLTFTITTGIAAGFVTYVFLKLVRGRAGEIHPLLWVVAIAFLLFFAVPWLQGLIAPPPAA
ncbi:MAG TPA: NCS2 family permease [Candidatus Limnocylindria bacterium]|nr:NCS2 family permease [Candidatus Limnocylindria bacterium]